MGHSVYIIIAAHAWNFSSQTSRRSRPSFRRADDVAWCLVVMCCCRWISVLNNAKEQVLMKAFGDASNSESSPYNQSVKELTRTILQQVRRLPGNQTCCDCGAAGN